MRPQLIRQESEQPSLIDLPGQVFAPTRLTLARERRGITKKDLAAELGLSADAITKFEKARCKPTKENVELCVRILDFPLEWFYDSEIELLDIEAPSFRSRRSMTKELKAKATRAGDMASGVISPYLHRNFVLPESKLPNLAGHTPEEAASYLRSQFGLGVGPISNMVHFLESVGVGVFWLSEASPTLDAWSVWHKDSPFVLLNQHTEAGCRGRFDAAHELGHLVLHRDADVIDGLQLEKEANQFAASFLMPPEQFLRECPRHRNLRAFFPLKKRWGVSLAAMIMQSQTHGHLTDWDSRMAFQDIAASGWRVKEPDEIAITRETSALHPAMWAQLQKRGYGLSSLARQMRISPHDLNELLPSFVEAPVKRPNLRLV